MAFMTHHGTVNGFPFYFLPSFKVGSTVYANYYIWYYLDPTPDNCRWVASSTLGYPLNATGNITVSFLTGWYHKNAKYCYDNGSYLPTPITPTWHLWWSSSLALYVISSKLGGGVSETWVPTDPETPSGPGAYQGDSWYSGAAISGTYNARGTLRGTTNGSYDATKSVTTAWGNTNRFEMASAAKPFGVFTGYGVFSGKTLCVGTKTVTLTSGSSVFDFTESFGSSMRFSQLRFGMGYPSGAADLEKASYMKAATGDMLLDETYTATFKSVSTVAAACELADTHTGYMCNEVILT